MKKAKAVYKYKSKKTGKFVSELTYKKLKHKGIFKRFKVDTRSKETKKLDKLGLKTKKQKDAFKKTVERFEKSPSFRSKLTKSVKVDFERGDYEGSHYQDLGKRFEAFLLDSQDGGDFVDFRAIFTKYRNLQNSKVERSKKNLGKEKKTPKGRISSSRVRYRKRDNR